MRALKVLKRHEQALCTRIAAEVEHLLGAAPNEADVARAARHAHAASDDEGGRVLAHAGGLLPACSAGCFYCCHVHADATVPEILAIFAHLEHTLSPEARRALQERLAWQAERVEHLSDEERWAAKIPCALLGNDGRCTIYEVRPLRCRAFHSCAVEPCRAAFAAREGQEPVINLRLARAHDTVEEGYDRALASKGLSAEGHRLEVGLLVALEDLSAGARWLAGEQAFGRALSPRRAPL